MTGFTHTVFDNERSRRDLDKVVSFDKDVGDIKDEEARPRDPRELRVLHNQPLRVLDVEGQGKVDLEVVQRQSRHS